MWSPTFVSPLRREADRRVLVNNRNFPTFKEIKTVQNFTSTWTWTIPRYLNVSQFLIHLLEAHCTSSLQNGWSVLQRNFHFKNHRLAQLSDIFLVQKLNVTRDFRKLSTKLRIFAGPRLLWWCTEIGCFIVVFSWRETDKLLRRSAVKQSISTVFSWNQHIEVSVLILLDGPPSSLRLINLKRPPWSRSYLEVLITIKTNMVHLMLLNGSPAIMCVLFITNFIVVCLFKYCMLCIHTRYNLALHRNVRETKT